jgi:hypothetical protein
LHPNFEVFIPIGRAINPITQGNWEASGVIPDISVVSGEAFEVAYNLALQKVNQNLTDTDQVPFQRLKEEAMAALEEQEVKLD